jgi:hypothetical protein
MASIYNLQPCVTSFCHRQLMSHEIFRPVLRPVWMHLGLNVNRLWFYKFSEAPSIFGNYFKFWCTSYETFSEIRESLRRIDNCLIETLRLLKNILGEPLNWLSIILGDSKNLREVLTLFGVFLGGLLTQNKEKLENRVLSCQTFSEILRISEKVWYEAHQNLK